MQINKDNIRENGKILDHEYKVGDKFMFKNNAAFKYDIEYKGLFYIILCFTNDTVKLQWGVIKIRYNIHHIKPNTYDTKIEGAIAENDVWQCQHLNCQLYNYVCIY